jgi:site-specific DNA-methyltransferase (adenine-specific)/site-specific DNA-methyltransferase (cytosine-N4-specific)
MIDIRIGDCFELIKDLPDNSVDLVITSPPYADIVNYGKNISIKKPQDYCDWLLPLFNEIYRVLKPSGSFILNINDNCSKGLRNPFIYELIYRSQKESKLKFYDTYIWHKVNGIPNGSTKRFRNNTEFIFHFVKNQKELKFYMDRVLQEPAESYTERFNGVTQFKQSEIVDGKRPIVKIRKTNKQVDERIIPEKVRPDNVFRFPTAGQARDNTIRHPAPYHKELPTYFINLLTDEGDIVLDVFSGIGTTGLGCDNRTYIGFEMNEKYAEFSKKRLMGEELINPKIYQYDQDDNLVGVYEYWSEVSKKYNLDRDKVRLDSAMIRLNGHINIVGYKWKLEKIKL